MILQKDIDHLLPGFTIVSADNGNRIVLQAANGDEVATYTQNTSMWTVRRDHEQSKLVFNQLARGGGKVEFEPDTTEQAAPPPRRASGWGGVKGIIDGFKHTGGGLTSMSFTKEVVIRTSNYHTAHALWIYLQYESRARFTPHAQSLEIIVPADRFKPLLEFFKDDE